MCQPIDDHQQTIRYALVPDSVNDVKSFTHPTQCVCMSAQTSRHALASGSACLADSRSFFSRSGSIAANRKKLEPIGWQLVSEKPDSNSLRLVWRLVSHSTLLLILACAGCNNLKTEEEEPEHFNPPHWPVNMLDAAEKIDARIAKLTSKDGSDSEKVSDVRSELNDLVEWAPEIAADTDLDESDWDEVYRISETLRAHMASSDVPVDDYRDDFGRLSELLKEFHQKVIVTSKPRDFGPTEDAVEPVPANAPANAPTTSEVP